MLSGSPRALIIKELERENKPLRKAVSNLKLDALVLKEAVEGKYCAPRGGGKPSLTFARCSTSPSAVRASRWGSIDPRSANPRSYRKTRSG